MNRQNRIISVDIFRGITIALMVLVNIPGLRSDTYAPLLHADWHGYTPTDLVFPFFLFIVGTSIVFAYKDKKAGAATYKKITIRSLKLIGLGLFLGAFTINFPFIREFSEIRFPGVLQRIGVVFFFGAVLFLNLDRKKLVGLTVLLLTGYWLLMTCVPVAGEGSTFERAPNNLANWLDVKVFGTHNYKPDYDPEGLLSTLPAIASVLLGVFSGLILLSKEQKKVALLLGLGSLFLLTGHLWGMVFPINKALWTSSFVMVTAGWANITLAIIYYLTDVKKTKFGNIFKYTGANAITVYFLSSFIATLFRSIKVDGEISVHQWLFNTIYLQSFIPVKFSSLLYGLSVVAFYCLLAHILYKRKVFIRV